MRGQTARAPPAAGKQTAPSLCDADKEAKGGKASRDTLAPHEAGPCGADPSALSPDHPSTSCGAGEWAVAAATRLNSSKRGCSTPWWPGMRCNTT